jgi:Protein of unknown function (DUF2789)
MYSNYHHFCELFEQLGLPSDPPGIAAFIQSHSPLSPDIRLEDASFWSPSQAALLRQHIQEDSDWAVVADKLNLSLRAARTL